MAHRHNKENRKVHAAARMASKPPENLKSLKDRLAHLPIGGESKKEIAKLKAKIALYEALTTEVQ